MVLLLPLVMYLLQLLILILCITHATTTFFSPAAVFVVLSCTTDHYICTVVATATDATSFAVAVSS